MDERTNAARPGFWPRVRQGAPLTLVTLAFTGIAIAGMRLGFQEEKQSRVRSNGFSVNPLPFEPKVSPPAVSASEAQLPDDTPVIGVTSGEYWRAYELAAFYRDEDHVLNDTVGGTPITVAYCPRSQCVRVYAGPTGAGILAVAVGGWVGRPGTEPDAGSVMMLRVGKTNYFQDTGDAVEEAGRFPYAEREFERMTWGEWKQAHPSTDVVTRTQTTGAERPEPAVSLETE